MPTTRLRRGFVALSASAVAAVYLAGYLRTQSADASLGATADPAPTAESVAVAVTAAAPTVVVRVQPTVGAAPAVQGTYKDGTYSGQGSSRRGGVVVSVIVQSGRIASVTITQSTLQYPLRDIAGLPAQVVQRQTAQVDTVSRATYSSQAFKGAVAQAPSKAA